MQVTKQVNNKNLSRNILISILIAFIYMGVSQRLVVDYSDSYVLWLTIPFIYPVIVGCIFLIKAIREKNNKAIYLSVAHIFLPAIIFALLAAIYTILLYLLGP